MYTVKELIESLQKCPPDYKIEVFNFSNYSIETFETLSINAEEKTVVFNLNY